MKKIIYVILLIVLCLQVNVLAAGEATLNVTCTKTSLAIGENSKCTLKASILSSVNITSISMDVTSDADLELSFAASPSFVGALNANRIVLSADPAQTGEQTLGVLTLTVKSGAIFGEKKWSLKNIQFSDTGNVYNSQTISKTLTVPSTINTLEGITIDGASVSAFSPDKLTYTVNSSATKILIGATKTDVNSTTTGTGEKTVDYGNNTYTIKVTSQNGVVKVYTINVYKEDNRSTDNTLRKLEVKGINFTFDKNKTAYSLNVDSNVEKVTITSTLNDTKASYVKSFGNRDVELEYGINKILVKVQSEKGVVKEYTLTINRDDDRSDNGELTSLKINGKDISLKAGVFEYSTELLYKQTKTIIESKVSEKATINYKDIDLVVGDNELKIEVVSEKGTKNEYIVRIKRLTQEESKVLISNIVVKNYNLNFSKNITSYILEVNNDTKMLDITVLPKEDEVSTSIIGNNNLENGSVVTINVKDDDGEHTYKINIVKKAETKLILGFLTINQLSYIIFSIGLLTFICSIIYTVKSKKEN